MNELNIKCNLESPQKINTTINFSVIEPLDSNLVYKFMIGFDGTWKVLRDFSIDTSIDWTPIVNGKYIVLIQAKHKDTLKPFEYASKIEYVVGESDNKIIKDIYIENEVLKIGDKLKVTVECNVAPIIYKYWIEEEDNWTLVKDYSPENTLVLPVKNSGKQKILVQVKKLSSDKDFDDSKEAEFSVEEVKKTEITNLECLSSHLLVGEELVFKVECNAEDSRMILFKFIKIDSRGKVQCIQDFSTKRTVSYIEKLHGEYKILVMAKDMYSPKEYDDRAVVNFKVKPYEEIRLESFTSDLSSPQFFGNEINFIAVVSGGNRLLYRFKVEGPSTEDTGYVNHNNYVWLPSKAGSYRITVWVKDESFTESYEAYETMDFIIDEVKYEAVKIERVDLDGDIRLLKGNSININVSATGGMKLKYSFEVKKDGVVKECIPYGDINWVNFTPEDSGVYEIDALVKDQFSKKDYDAHSVTFVEAFDFLPATIDYVLLPMSDNYLVGDKIEINTIIRNTKNVLIRYDLKINGHKVEETGYVRSKKYHFTPKCAGVYTIDIMAKNKDGDRAYDCKKTVRFLVRDAMPITGSKIVCDKTEVKVNEAINFYIKYHGGKDVVFQYYLMEKGEWNLVQDYSKKNYYDFMPFSKGEYKVLALCKSSERKCAYEDYDMLILKVTE